MLACLYLPGEREKLGRLYPGRTDEELEIAWEVTYPEFQAPQNRLWNKKAASFEAARML